VGVSTPLSGGGAVWGMEMKWAAEEICKRVNKAGGITVNGQNYVIEPIIYDNKYSAAEGGKVAKKLVYGDKADFLISMGTPPTMAMQNVTEKKKMVLFETSWNSKCNGAKVPYSFLIINSPETIYPLAFEGIKKRFPHIKTAIGIAPNDEAAWGSAKLSKELWKNLGVEYFAEFYERGTADFLPIVTKVMAKKPDIIDTGGTATGAALTLKVLHEMKWEGIKFNGPMPGWKMVVKAAGIEAVEGLMGGLAPNFKGGLATPIQKELAAKCESETGVELSSLGICAWDSIQALIAAIKEAQSLDHDVIRDTLPKIIFQSSYGPMAIGNSNIWDRSAQFLIPTCISEIKDGKLHEMMRIISPELKERLTAAGIDWKKHYPE